MLKKIYRGIEARVHGLMLGLVLLVSLVVAPEWTIKTIKEIVKDGS